MDGIDKLNQAIDYIEQHLNEDIDYQVLADIAGCSSYYFQKLFLYMAQLSLSEYIRFRRLSMAAVDLQKTKCKVI
ncbi:MAG TPA: AraC family transcriptional regulator, partial [Dielma fastidiosa]|nr:AraC family transcriptional regulator [Dielma fastidiosa]